MNEENEKPSYAIIAFYLLTWAIIFLIGGYFAYEAFLFILSFVASEGGR